MEKIETQDAPLVIDAIFVLVCMLAARIFKDEEINNLGSLLEDRFVEQNFPAEQSKAVAKTIENALREIKTLDNSLG